MTLGEDIRIAIGLDGTVVEFEIPSNRPDCLSVIGLAREAAATYKKSLHIKTPVVEGKNGDINSLLSVEVQNSELCKRYVAMAVSNLKISPSPRWLRERLRASGVRPLHNFFEFTTCVMLD